MLVLLLEVPEIQINMRAKFRTQGCCLACHDYCGYNWMRERFHGGDMTAKSVQIFDLTCSQHRSAMLPCRADRPQCDERSDRDCQWQPKQLTAANIFEWLVYFQQPFSRVELVGDGMSPRKDDSLSIGAVFPLGGVI